MGSSGSNGITISGPRYLTFDNLVIDASAAEAAGFKVTGSAGYIRLQNSEVRNAGTQGILTTDSTGGNEFLNVKVHDNGRNTQFDHGLYISSSDNVVEGCEIYNNANFGVHVYGEGTSIDRNIVRKNRIYGNGSAMVIGAGDNNMAYNNLVYSNGTGIQIRNGGTGNKVYNNSIYNNRGGDSGGSCILNVNDGTIIRNNICYQNQTNAINGDGSATTSNNLFENPSFVNASAADFHLQAGSAASDTGFDLSSVITTDYAGTARPQGSGFDIGAYEFGGGSLPAPRNLHITSTK